MGNFIELIVIIIFIVGALGSFAQKIAEQRRRGQRDEDQVPPELPPETRRMLFGEPQEVKTAKPKGAKDREEEMPPAEPVPGRQLFDALFGPMAAQEEEEGDWEAPPPATRRELPRRTHERGTRPTELPQQPPASARHQAEAREAAAERRRRAAEQREAQRRMRQRQEAAARPQPTRTRAQTAKTQRSRTHEAAQARLGDMAAGKKKPSIRPGRRITRPERPSVTMRTAPMPQTMQQFLMDRDNLRQIFVLAEILGPPKSLNERGAVPTHEY